MGESRDVLIFKAKLSEEAERFDDMVTYMKEVVKTSDSSLTDEERIVQRNLLSVAFKNVIGTRRAAWRIVSAFIAKKKDSLSDQEKEVAKNYKSQIEKELQDIIDDVTKLLDEYIVPKDSDSVSKEEADERAFYLKMKGDYYRYNAEFVEEKREEVIEKASKAYEEANKVAQEHLSATNPIRLGLVLNYSVFYYEIKQSPDEACKIAKEAFDNAIAELDSLSENSYKDSTLIMQLLRDNLTLWTSDEKNNDDDQN